LSAVLRRKIEPPGQSGGGWDISPDLTVGICAGAAVVRKKSAHHVFVSLSSMTDHANGIAAQKRIILYQIVAVKRKRRIDQDDAAGLPRYRRHLSQMRGDEITHLHAAMGDCKDKRQ